MQYVNMKYTHTHAHTHTLSHTHIHTHLSGVSQSAVRVRAHEFIREKKNRETVTILHLEIVRVQRPYSSCIPFFAFPFFNEMQQAQEL